MNLIEQLLLHHLFSLIDTALPIEVKIKLFPHLARYTVLRTNIFLSYSLLLDYRRKKKRMLTTSIASLNKYDLLKVRR